MSNDLDADFYEISSDIKVFIHKVDNKDHFKQYALWLKRLYNAPLQEKLQRNEYLYILAEQIRQRILKAPFTSLPPSGRLPQLHSLENLKFLCDNASEKNDVNYVTTLEATPAQSLEHLETVRLSSTPFNSITCSLFEPLAKSVKTTKVSSDNILTDSDCCAECCTKEHCNLIASNHELKQTQNLENEGLSQDKFHKLQKIQHLKKNQDEIEILQSRMDDLLEVKEALKDAYCLTEDRKTTIIKLQNKLSVMQAENQELKLKMEKQLKNNFEINKIESKHKMKIDCLNEFHQNKVTNMEETYKNKLKALELELKLKTNEIMMELDKTVEMNKTSAKQLKIKEDHIQRLQNEIENNKTKSMQDKTVGKQYENNQTRYLKKSLLKLQRWSEKNEMQHLKEIDQLKHELSLRNLSNEMKWQQEKTKLIINNNIIRQKELKEAVDDLEYKYKAIVEDIQQKKMSR